MEESLDMLARMLRTYLTPERFRQLGESWFWGLFEDVRNRIRCGETDLSPTILEALARWWRYRMGCQREKGLSWPGRRGNPTSCEAHAVHLVAAWLAGDLDLPDLPRPSPGLRIVDITRLARVALAERWGGSGHWSTLLTVKNVYTLLARLRRQGDFSVHLPPEDLGALMDSVLGAS